MTEDYNIIKEGDYAILKTDKQYIYMKVSKSGNVLVCRHKLKLASIIGHHFGHTYEVKGDMLVKREVKVKDNSKKNIESLDKDNRNIFDDGKSQKLSHEDIKSLKDDGLSGKEIIETLVENSATFNDKTEYSKEKYLNKKKSKYDTSLSVLKPTIRLISEMYYQNNPLKIMNLRIDSLSQMLAIGNVQSGGTYIVFENGLGLLTACVLQRIGKTGNVIQLHSGDLPIRNAVELMNFNEDQLNCLSSFPFQKLAEVNNYEEFLSKRIRIDETESDEKKLRRQKRQADQQKSADILKERKIDGVFIASKFDPCDVVPHITEYLSSSRPLVVYCSYKEPLASCFKKLKVSNSYINIRLTETWLRNYQVLPERSHPKINMSSGGYLLSAVKVS